MDKLKFEEESQVMAIENILVKIDTFTFPMDCVTWGTEGDLQNSQILRRPLPFSSQARININKGELTLLVGEEKAKGNFLWGTPFLIDVLASTAHKGNCFEEIVAEPLATIKGNSEFIFPLQHLEEIILELNGYKEEVMSKMDDWPNGSTSTFPMSLAGL